MVLRDMAHIRAVDAGGKVRLSILAFDRDCYRKIANSLTADRIAESVTEMRFLSVFCKSHAELASLIFEFSGVSAVEDPSRERAMLCNSLEQTLLNLDILDAELEPCLGQRGSATSFRALP